MSRESYTICHLGHIITREHDNFHVTTSEGRVETVPLNDGEFTSDHIRITGGDAYIQDIQVIKQGRALCYTVHHGGYTFTRPAGNSKILIQGHGIRANMNWNNPMSSSTPSGAMFSMENGAVVVGNTYVIRDGMLEAHGVQMAEAEEDRVDSPPQNLQMNAQSTQTTPHARASQPSVYSMHPSTAPSVHGIRPASQFPARDRPVPQPESFRVTKGSHVVIRYPDYFVHHGPRINNNKVGLKATSSGNDFMFCNGDVWLENRQVIRDGQKLPDDDPGRPRPSFSIWD